MARIELRIQNPTNRLVLKTMLEAEGHVVATPPSDAVISDDFTAAGTTEVPLLLLAQADQLAEAVKAMCAGAYGYIIVPFLPREAGMMVQRAMAAPRASTAPPERRTLADVERDHIRAVLRACNNNQSEAAQVLGIARNTLWRRMKAMGDDTKSHGSSG